jgi:hypothetical protein
LTQEPETYVKIPSADCILGDKLTAFAPHTTGVLFGYDKELEIIKQFFDIANLIDNMSNQCLTVSTYDKAVIEEINYRGLGISKNDVLMDTINTAMNIVNKGNSNPEEYKLLVSGIRSITSHIIGSKYSGEKAAVDACKVLYLATCILTDNKFMRIKDSGKYAEESLNGDVMRKSSYMRKLDLTAYGYLVEASKLLAFYVTQGGH